MFMYTTQQDGTRKDSQYVIIHGPFGCDLSEPGFIQDI
jgi:hypothetical protein